jgi:hypothetical protein
MTTHTITMSSKAVLVDAYEALREAVVYCGASATLPVGGQCLLREGLLAWGQPYRACGAQASVLNPDHGGIPQGLDMPSEQPRAAVVSLLATMALQSINHLETIS